MNSPTSGGREELQALTVAQLFDVLWRGKLWLSSTMLLCILASLVYALTATKWYRAEVVIVPAERRSMQGLTSQLSGLGSLASLAGITVGGAGNAEAVAVLQSRDFARAFIEDHDLLTVLLFERWDESTGEWRADSPEDRPDVRDGVRFFKQNVMSVSEEPQTGLVTLTIDWIDPDAAAEWANLLARRLNDRMRARTLAEAEANVQYLESQLSSTTLAALQQSISRLLENELQRLMLAKGTEEFAFRIVDRAHVPKEAESPKPLLIMVLSIVVGSVAGSGVALTVFALRSSGAK